MVNSNQGGMSHPFINTNDLSDLSVDELQTKILELNKKLSILGRMPNEYVAGQIRMALHSYQEAYNKKLQEQYKKLNLNSKIDINNSSKASAKNVVIDTHPVDPLPPYLT